ncbi:MAG TPA: efflux RND transporter periplasmic adaptor subunit [Polyangiaceae bacterium]|jgi:membrane fusion protein (multidrug efflux system)
MVSNTAGGDVRGAAGGLEAAGSRRRWPRIVAALLGLLVLVAILGAVKGAQIMTLIGAGKKMKAAGPPPETVATAVAQEQTWDQTLESVGSVAAAQGVSIGNDAPGIVSRIAFESGETVREGQVLVELDTRVERAQLASARARQALAQETLKRTQALFATGAIAQSQLDTDTSQLNGATADADALAAQIDRKTVKAPFAGKLGIRLVNVGQYLAPGTPITVLEAPEATYIDFDLPQQDLSLVRVGMPVRLALDTPDAGAAHADGAVFAIEPAVDPTTRNIKLRATLPAKDQWLRPGMFVRVSVVEPQKADVVAIPATSVVHAPYGDSVFLVETAPAAGGSAAPPAKIARQQFVRVGDERGDFVAIADGVKAGEEVVSAGAFKLRNGTHLAINNAVQAPAEFAPRPANH